MKASQALRSFVVFTVSAALFVESAVAAPQASQSSSSAQAVSTQGSFGALWQEFKGGESVYDAPEPDKLLEYPSVKNNPAAIKELASLVVRYGDLAKAEEKGANTNEALRTLGLTKARFYFKYGLSQSVLKVAPTRATAYITFWQSFWKRVDLFERGYRGDLSAPGPFVLPAATAMTTTSVALNEGIATVASALEKVLRIEESFAQVRQNECRVVLRGRPTPVLNCGVRERDERFYYKSISKRGTAGGAENPVRFTAAYDDNYDCKLVPGCKRERTGGVFIATVQEIEWCGSKGEAIGDAKGEPTRYTRLEYKDGEIKRSFTEYHRYCIDSNDAAYPRYQEAYAKDELKRVDWKDDSSKLHEPEFYCPYNVGEAFTKELIRWDDAQLNLAQRILESYSVDSKGFHHLTIPSGVSDRDAMEAMDRWYRDGDSQGPTGFIKGDIPEITRLSEQSCGTQYPLERRLTVMPVVPGTEGKSRVAQQKILSDRGLQFSCMSDQALVLGALRCHEPLSEKYEYHIRGSVPGFALRTDDWYGVYVFGPYDPDGFSHVAASGSPSPESKNLDP